MNSFNGIGRLVADMELKKTANEKPFVRFKLAINRRVKNAQGEYAADFLPFTAWGKTAEYLSKYTGKGDLLSVNGMVQSNSYTNTEGTTIYTVEILCQQASILSKVEKQEKQETTVKQSQVELEAEMPF